MTFHASVTIIRIALFFTLMEGINVNLERQKSISVLVILSLR